MTLASRLTTDSQGQRPAWEELPAADVGAIALTIRQAWLGERIGTDARCPSPGCRERMDIAFEVPAYIAHHRPELYPGVTRTLDPGWFELVSPAEPTLSIGTIEVSLLSPPPPVPARPAQREPPERLSRGLGRRFGQGQV